MAKLNADIQARWQALEAEWKDCIQPIYETIRAANAAAEELFPGMAVAGLEKMDAAAGIQKRGEIRAPGSGRWRNLPRRLPKDKRLALPGPAKFSVPLALAYPLEGSILFETAKTGGDEAIAAINNIIFRLLSTTPPGKLSFTIFDPVGLGQNFAALMHLADYEESHINSRIWTQTDADRGKARGIERAHGKGHPDVSPQRIRDHRRIQRAGRQHRREISFPRHRSISR